MKASDFDLSQEIIFEPQRGLTSWGKTRLVIFDARAMGLLRNSVLEMLGWHRTQRFFLQFGYRHGYLDFLQMRHDYEFDSELELLASGPVIHSWEGIVNATPTEIRFDRETGEFFFTGVWKNSYEAEQHLDFREAELVGHHESSPVCWTLMGYASGWCTAFFGKPLLTIEPKCMGMGHEHCEWKIQPPAVWGKEAAPYIEALQELWDNPGDWASRLVVDGNNRQQ